MLRVGSPVERIEDLRFLRGLGLVTVNTEEDGFHHLQRDGMIKRTAKFVVRRVLVLSLEGGLGRDGLSGVESSEYSVVRVGVVVRY